LAHDGTGLVQRTPLGGRRSPARDAGPSATPLPALTTNSQRLAAALGFSGRPGSGSAAQFQAFTALAARQPLQPQVRADLEMLLARLPGLIYSGEVPDRAGRPGVAVSIDAPSDGHQIRTVLIFDPQTGALLESDQILVSEPGRLPLREGAVLAYTTFLDADYTATP
jgi:hypothetical protein